jgi:hypothetical protein
VAALEVAVDGGTKVAEKEFLVSTELLMKQLLKLDSIEAEGEAKLQRKAEVSVLCQRYFSFSLVWKCYLLLMGIEIIVDDNISQFYCNSR